MAANMMHPKKRYREWTASESASSADSRPKMDQILINSSSNPDMDSKIYATRIPCPKKRFLAKERSREIGELRSSFKPENHSVRISPPIPVLMPSKSPTQIPTKSTTDGPNYSGNSGPYNDGTTPPSRSYGKPNYSRSLNATPRHGQNRRGSYQPFYSANFVNYRNRNCQRYIPPMVNFCLPPPPIFPNLSMPLYQQPPNGNVFEGCSTSFRFPDPVYSNRVTQTMPYSSPKEVEMETGQEDSVGEPASLPVAAPRDTNRDPRFKPPVRDLPEENKVAIEAVFAKPHSYTLWRKPAPIRGIIKPFYHNPKNDNPRLNTIRETKPIVSDASNNDHRWRFMAGPSSQKIKFRIGDLPPKCHPFVAPKRGDSSMTKPEGHPSNPNSRGNRSKPKVTEVNPISKRQSGDDNKKSLIVPFTS